MQLIVVIHYSLALLVFDNFYYSKLELGKDIDIDWEDIYIDINWKDIDIDWKYFDIDWKYIDPNLRQQFHRLLNVVGSDEVVLVEVVDIDCYHFMIK